MRILVVGSGGREHALAWKIVRSPLVDKLYCAPGNPGMDGLAECVAIAPDNIGKLAAFAKEKAIDLTVVGPEDPLAKGIVNEFDAAGLTVFGPTAEAARLEASKAFAKKLMTGCNIPTASYAEFTDAAAAVAYIQEQKTSLVVKADGLAAGKGVTVAHTQEKAIEAVHAAMTDRVFGDAGRRIIIEECLSGEEASILAFSDGANVLTMVPSQDHKPAFDGDKGPNTGGMGAYSPAPVVTPGLLDQIEKTILRPCIRGMAENGTPYRGVLYAGLIVTSEGPKVIEFNCRFGDPETQVIVPRMKSDIVAAFLACCKGSLNEFALEWQNNACVTVVMASGGYPGPYEKGKLIEGITDAESDPGVTVFHAGTTQTDKGFYTNGGRVLDVTAVAPDIPKAIEKAYQAVDKIRFDKAHYRKDIGKKALIRTKV